MGANEIAASETRCGTSADLGSATVHLAVRNQPLPTHLQSATVH